MGKTKEYQGENMCINIFSFLFQELYILKQKVCTPFFIKNKRKYYVFFFYPLIHSLNKGFL
jgi:hypothetical protein